MPGLGPKSLLVQAPEPDQRLDGPRLCVELTPRWREFSSNLGAVVRRYRPEPTGIRPGRFWADVFVRTDLPWGILRKSYLLHALGVSLVWALTYWGFLGGHELPVRSPYDHTTITYYNVSEYLPPLNPEVKAAPAKIAKRADPVYAKQEIVSIRPNADNNHQTIISPSSVKLNHDVALPNIVSWAQRPAVPASAVSHASTNLNLAALTSSPVAPAPQVTRVGVPNLPQLEQPTPVNAAPQVSGHMLNVPSDILAKSVVAPPPVVTGITSHNLDIQTAAVPPPPAPDALRRAGQINLGNMATAASPTLAVPEQQAIAAATRQGSGRPGAGALAQMASGGQVVPPPPAGIPGGSNSQAVGQLVALGLNPAVATGPISVPNGSRDGSFAAGPTGHPGAAGTPEIRADGKSNGPGGIGSPTSNPLDGIHVGPGEGSQPAAAIVVAGPTAPQHAAPAQGGKVKEVLMASLKKPSDLATVRPPDSLASAPQRNDEVFGAKKYYTMQLNMPNLTSSSGTWIMRFAELTQSRATGELTAPVALSAVHPAYPLELIRDRIEGTVVLYAVIHTDGSVGEVKILHGVNDRLDSSARAALEKWRFRPGTRNGSAVAIEAVVQIPFVASHKSGL